MPISLDEATIKLLAKRQRKQLATLLPADHLPSLMVLQTTLAQAAGHKDWHAAQAWWANTVQVSTPQPAMGLAIPDIVLTGAVRRLRKAFALSRQWGGTNFGGYSYMHVSNALAALYPYLAQETKTVNQADMKWVSPASKPTAFLERLLGAPVEQWEATFGPNDTVTHLPALLSLAQAAPVLERVMAGRLLITHHCDTSLHPTVHRDDMMDALATESGLACLVAKAGAELYEPYYDVGSFLHRAGACGQPFAVALLHQAGFNLDHRNMEGQTVLDIALNQPAANYNAATVEMLWELGYRPTQGLEHRALGSLIRGMGMAIYDMKPDPEFSLRERKENQARDKQDFQNELAVLHSLRQLGLDLDMKIFIGQSYEIRFGEGIMSVRDILSRLVAEEKPSKQMNEDLDSPSYLAIQRALDIPLMKRHRAKM